MPPQQEHSAPQIQVQTTTTPLPRNKSSFAALILGSLAIGLFIPYILFAIARIDIPGLVGLNMLLSTLLAFIATIFGILGLRSEHKTKSKTGLLLGVVTISLWALLLLIGSMLHNNSANLAEGPGIVVTSIGQEPPYTIKFQYKDLPPSNISLEMVPIKEGDRNFSSSVPMGKIEAGGSGQGSVSLPEWVLSALPKGNYYIRVLPVGTAGDNFENNVIKSKSFTYGLVPNLDSYPESMR